MLNLNISDIISNPRSFVNKTYKYGTKYRPNATFTVCYTNIMFGLDWTEAEFIGIINDPDENKNYNGEKVYFDDPDLKELN